MRRTAALLVLAALLLPGCAGTETGSSAEKPVAPTAGENAAPQAASAAAPNVGYSDTPVLPGSKYRVHDGTRPQPKSIHVGDQATLPAPGAAPSDARILFDGNDLSQWRGGSGDARWKLTRGAMEVNGTGDIRTRDKFGDVQLHLEFRTPTGGNATSQGRGNSGVFFMDRYEVQVLDSFRNPTYPDGQAAAIYGQRPPLVNASLPPGQWQTYDIVFVAPRFAKNGDVVSPARVTVFHNGVLVQYDVPLSGPTRHRTLTEYEPHGPAGPIRLQDHGNPVQFRNIWLRPLQGVAE